jgi:short-chain fatty acids transporter
LQRLSSDRISRFAQGLGTLVPDATSASVILLLIVAAAALAFGNTFSAIADAYYRGLWMLLPFTMQMTLILVLSSVVIGTSILRRLVVALARWPRTLTQVIALGVVLEAALSYL